MEDNVFSFGVIEFEVGVALNVLKFRFNIFNFSKS